MSGFYADGGSYDDIIDLDRPVSSKHPPMDRLARAAQFAPFEALTGLEELMDDTADDHESAVTSEIEYEEFIEAP